MAALCGLGSVLITTPASAAAFTNGSFESPNVQGFRTLSAGQSIGPWTVVSGDVDLLGSNIWQTADGSQLVDLNGFNAGRIAQTFDTIPGNTYELSFALAGNPGGAPVKTGQVLLNGQLVENLAFDTTGKTIANMGWVRHSHVFTASGSSTTVEFLSTISDLYGPALDNVVVTSLAPTVSVGGPYSGSEGATIPIAGTVTDPDGPSLSVGWSVTGTACAIANPAALSTTVTCADNGAFTLALTANDSVNQAVVATTTLTVTNVAPTVSISTPANGDLFVRGTPVTFTAPFTDPGHGDTHVCSVDFADGTSVAAGMVTESSGSGTCVITHAFSALGPHDVLMRITDDDGGSDTAAVRVVIYLPGEAFAIQANGPVTVAKTPHATCPPNQDLIQPSLTTPVGGINGLEAHCTLDPTTGTTTASATIGNTSLLLGAITISTVRSTCVAGPTGITRSSTVGTINGIPIGTGTGSLGIPGVATVFYNETTTTPDGKLAQNAIRIRTLLGQEIILAACRLG